MDYINRESVLQILSDKNAAWGAYQKVQSIPAADVRPVKRGRWEYNPGDNIPYCSECMMPQDSECNFCPNCGADMREKS